MKMTDLIDRNELLGVMDEYLRTDLDDFGRKDVLTAILRQGFEIAIDHVEDAPAVRNVVHCRECELYNSKCEKCDRVIHTIDGCYGDEDDWMPDDFCSKGVKKEA